jgi:hypothetical protein
MATRPLTVRVGGVWVNTQPVIPVSSHTHLSSDFNVGQHSPQGAKNGDLWIANDTNPPQKFWYWGEIIDSTGRVINPGSWHSDSGVRSFIQALDPISVAGGSAKVKPGDLWVTPGTVGHPPATQIWTDDGVHAAAWQPTSGATAVPSPKQAPIISLQGENLEKFDGNVYYKYVGFVDTKQTSRSFLGFRLREKTSGDHAHTADYKGTLTFAYGNEGISSGAATFKLQTDSNAWVYFQPSGWPDIKAQRMPITFEWRNDPATHTTYIVITQTGFWSDGRSFSATANILLDGFNGNALELDQSGISSGGSHEYHLRCIATA